MRWKVSFSLGRGRAPVLSPVVTLGHSRWVWLVLFLSPHSLKAGWFRQGLACSRRGFCWGGWKLYTAEELLLKDSKVSRGCQHLWWEDPAGSGWRGELVSCARSAVRSTEAAWVRGLWKPIGFWEKFTERFRKFKKNLENLYSFSTYRSHTCSL